MFYLIFELIIERLNKQWWGWWFETASRLSWRHCNEIPTECLSLVHGRWSNNFASIIYKRILRISLMSTALGIVIRWMLQKKCWWCVRIGSCNGLVPAGNKPLPEPFFYPDIPQYGVTTPQIQRYQSTISTASELGHHCVCRCHGPLARYVKLRVRMRRECRERFPRHRVWAIPTFITARAWRTSRDACRGR